MLRSSAHPGAPRALERASLHKRMHRHQHAGVAWLFQAHLQGGGILGDEPGLGKTFQVVVLVDALISASLVQRALIVAPAEMETMWAAQFKKFLPRAALELTGLHRAVKNEYCAHTHTRGQIGSYLEIVISKAL
mmetsp:Transcript_18855/g.28378  ORF Transcript_18855/g.28378 Transcript_18855/m.28378 type:complete len:134 (+) Transcript_18855:445-846(+)